MNNKLRALCKSLKKDAPVVAQPQLEEETQPQKQDPLSMQTPVVRARAGKEAIESVSAHPEYKISETERRRRLISSYRNESVLSDNLTPYELAQMEAKREQEQLKQEECKRKRREDLEFENTLRVDKDVFNILSIYKAPNGAMTNPKVLNTVNNTFKFDVNKVMDSKLDQEEIVKAESKVTSKDYKKYKKEFKKWVQENNEWFKKRHLKYLGKETEATDANSQDYDQHILLRDFSYPCLFKNSRMNLDMKNQLWQSIKKSEDEIKYLNRDIQSINVELNRLRKQKAEIIAQSLVNEMDMKISGEMYQIYFLKDQEEKLKRKERDRTET